MNISAEAKETADEKWTKLYSSVQVEGRTFLFSPPLSVVLHRDREVWTASNADLDIDVVDPSPEGAVDSFGMELLSLWDHIATEHDDKLTRDAQLLKKKLFGRIKESK